MKIFVTGGAGFIGSNYVRGLLGGLWGQNSDTVTVFDSLTYAGNLENLAPVRGDSRFTFVQGDIRNPSEVKHALKGHNCVVHFAAESHVDRSIHSPSIFIETNVLGTQVLLEEALSQSITTFVHVSTDEVYGSIESGSWDESCPLLPNSPYAASKASSDLVARAYWRTYGLDVRITRCSNNFGPYQYPEKVIPLFVTNLMDNLQVPLYGDGTNIRDWLHVNDHCRGIDLVLRSGSPGEIYNIGGGTELTNRELTNLILRAMNKGPEMIRPVNDRQGHDKRYSVDWSKIRDQLGFSPKESLTNSVSELIKWYQSNEQWWRPLKGL